MTQTPMRRLNTGARDCEAAILDPGRSCSRETYCYRVNVCRREAAAYRQGGHAWEADIPCSANPYALTKGDTSLAPMWSQGWRERAAVKG